jgi:hypothetical protein
MAFDEELASRIRSHLDGDLSFSERRMFGGLAFMCLGNMAFGIIGNDLMVRVGPEAYEEALGAPHARVMDFTGRAMRGFVAVEPEGLVEEGDLEGWLERGERFASSLPPK